MNIISQRYVTDGAADPKPKVRYDVKIRKGLFYRRQTDSDQYSALLNY